MDRSLDEIVAERHQPVNRGGFRGRGRGPPPPRRGNYDYPRDGVRKAGYPMTEPKNLESDTGSQSTRDERTNLDNDWVHDRYDDDESRGGGHSRPRGRRDDRDDRIDTERERAPPPVAKLRVDNLHWDLTEDDIYELFTRIAPVADVKLRYDRAGRSEGVAFVTYEHVADAKSAIREFDGANAKGQPIRLQLIPLPRRENPFDRVENPRSLFDRIEAPSGRDRDRRRSESPRSDIEEDRERGYRRGTRRPPAPPRDRDSARDRRSDVTKPPPENIDRYVPGSGGPRGGSRSSSHRGVAGRRPGERRERAPRKDDAGHALVGGRPRKTQEELDAEMEDYWGSTAGNGTAETKTDPAVAGMQGAEDDIDMIE